MHKFGICEGQGLVRAMADMKHFIPSNLTNVKQKLLLLYVRSFQWRSLHKSRDVLLKSTGLYLKKLRR